MNRYHINPATGEVGLCKASKGNCPFGGAENHYYSKALARQAYEEKMAPQSFSGKSSVPEVDAETEKTIPIVEVQLSQLSFGEEAILAADVRKEGGGAALLKEGVELTPDFAQRLRNIGINSVWLRKNGVAPSDEPLLPEELNQRVKAIMDSCVQGLEESAVAKLSEKDFQQVKAAAQEVSQRLASHPEWVRRLENLSSADSYSYAHSLRVTTLGLMLGQKVLARDGWTDGSGHNRHDHLQERLTDLGTGLLLHDIGKAGLPRELLDKEGKLTPQEFAKIKTHTTLGSAMLSETSISARSLDIVRDHHEKWDGTGYGGKKGVDIPQFARIAAIADVYDALTGARPYKEGIPMGAGVRAIVEGANSHFDPRLVRHFVDLVSFTAPQPQEA